eukprot:6422257-Pyramimonas_sp.AAC.1
MATTPSFLPRASRRQLPRNRGAGRVRERPLVRRPPEAGPPPEAGSPSHAVTMGAMGRPACLSR